MPTPVSRRSLVEIGAGALAAAALAPDASSAETRPGETSRNELIVRKYYKMWEVRDWGPLDAILADDFTFTSPNGDDHISKAAFKQKCWEPNIDLIKRIEPELVMAKGDTVFVKYICHVRNGKSFSNVEIYRVRDLRISAIECYFGGAGFPAAISS